MANKNLWDKINKKKEETEVKKQIEPENIDDKKEMPVVQKVDSKKGLVDNEIYRAYLKLDNLSKQTFLQIKSDIQDVLLESHPNEDLSKRANDEEFRQDIKKEIYELVNEKNKKLALTKLEKESLTTILFNDTLSFGPITPLLDDPEVSEIMVNGSNNVYVEKNGKLVKTDVFFDNDNHIKKIAGRILSPLNRRVDEQVPYVDARLPDGSRVNIIIPPLAIKGSTITIRKFEKDPFTMDDLVSFGTLSSKAASFLDACVKARLNIVVSGGTGSGKTTTLNVLSACIPADERIVTIEDAAELQLRQDHVVTLESRPSSITGDGEITIRDLVRNSLRMRPDRIIVGECRSGEALDMLQAMNTGHDGSLTTGHANTPRDMLSRLETMVLMAGMNMPISAIRPQIASAINLIIQQSRLKDGSRRITEITEVQGMEGEQIVLLPLFEFKREGFDENGKIKGELRPTGYRPSFMEEFESFGVEIPENLFAKQ